MRRFHYIVYIALIVITPLVTSAQTVTVLLESLKRWVGLATPVAAGLALLAFFWGLAKYIFAAGSEDAKEKGRSIMTWGIIALFVMVSIWGIIRFLSSSILGTDNPTQSIDAPCLSNLPGC